jgi:hypothetical protein
MFLYNVVRGASVPCLKYSWRKRGDAMQQSLPWELVEALLGLGYGLLARYQDMELLPSWTAYVKANSNELKIAVFNPRSTTSNPCETKIYLFKALGDAIGRTRNNTTPEQALVNLSKLVFKDKVQYQ